ncbi:DUF4397 domain-containing protein [Daejeonella lutea]|uniref:DUF4397 domain-containing protein n=1 Tax=Daejeonella lutea TaxID=572036 RepID=A0A1T5A3L8_9SPHI|nr:DUF4397 domain-containing protein [Daejeonella lutea]SKB29580.1 protein of unknown function [Daejeonella lutea]
MKKTSNTRRYSKLAALILLAGIFLSSCVKDLSNDGPQNASALNVVNASPGPLVINFFLNNNLVNGPALGYSQESRYVVTSSGSKKFDAATGGTFNSIVADTIALENDKYYSMFVTGLNNSLSTFVTEDDLSLPPSGKAKIRFINLSPDGGSFSLAIKGGAKLFSGQAYKTASTFNMVDPGVYMFELRNSENAVEHEASLDVAAGKIYTIWAGGLKEGVDELDLRLLIRANN